MSRGIHFAHLALTLCFSCGLDEGGAAWRWGANDLGQLGDGTQTPSAAAGELGTPADPDPCAPYECSLVPVAVRGGHAFTLIVAGSLHTCALEPGGAAWCWGYSDKREAGRGSDMSPAYTDTPVAVTGGLAFAHLTGGPDHTCGLTTGGAA